MKKNFLLIGALILVCITCALLIKINLDMKTSLEQLKYESESVFGDRVKEERGKIKRNFEEKHRADMVSYKAMIKRLEAEKQKTSQMQEEISGLKAQGGK